MHKEKKKVFDVYFYNSALKLMFSNLLWMEKASEFDQEISQSETADQIMAQLYTTLILCY